MRLADASILITGASSGIGAALARVLAARGARLTLAARREVRLHGLAVELARSGAAPPRVVPGDITAPGQPGLVVTEALSAWGRIDVVINNAGISTYGEAGTLPTEELRRILDVNFVAPVRIINHVLPHFLERGAGCLVSVGSLAALYGVPFLGAYGASKAALMSYTQSLRAELRGTGIRAMAVYPNYTDTELFLKEARTGSARRPRLRYEHADTVAKAMVTALEQDREEVVLTFTGKALQRARGLAPSLLDRVMAGLASRLRNGTPLGGKP